eukprot:508678-Pyramimonas_sp.AAC.1
MIDHVSYHKLDSVDVFVQLSGVPGDHAFLGTDLFLLPRPRHKRRPPHWRPEDPTNACSFAMRSHPVAAELLYHDDWRQRGGVGGQGG